MTAEGKPVMNLSIRRSAFLLVWVLQGAMAFVMVRPGIQKFTGTMWSRMFEVWGYPDGFYLVVGAIEVVAGIALLLPRLASAAALLLMAVMAGAAGTLFFHGRDGIGELMFLGLLGVVAFARWPGIFARRRTAPPTAAPGPVRA